MIELNKIYSFKVDELFHPNCPKGVVTSMTDKIRKDGRTSSPIITSFVSEKWFTFLEYVDEKFRDFVGCGYNIEKKMWSRHSTKFCPSYMVGSGRKIDPKESLQICKDNKLVYLFANATDFPNVYVTFRDGVEMHERHKSCSIGYNNKWTNFYFGINVPSK
tara:strand:+ start:99 stop:581 length:483 start_codon:yes stop_codon:yes gene_type:complete